MHGERSSAGSISMLISRVAVKIITMTLLIFVCYAAVNTGFRFGFTMFCADSAEPAPGTDVEITIEDGEGIDELAERLCDEGAIPNRYAFMIQARLYDLEPYPGTYKLNTSMSVREAVKSLKEGAEDIRENAASESALEESVIGGGDEGAEADAAELETGNIADGSSGISADGSAEENVQGSAAGSADSIDGGTAYDGENGAGGQSAEHSSFNEDGDIDEQ